MATLRGWSSTQNYIGVRAKESKMCEDELKFNIWLKRKKTEYITELFCITSSVSLIGLLISPIIANKKYVSIFTCSAKLCGVQQHFASTASTLIHYKL